MKIHWRTLVLQSTAIHFRSDDLITTTPISHYRPMILVAIIGPSPTCPDETTKNQKADTSAFRPGLWGPMLPFGTGTRWRFVANFHVMMIEPDFD